MNTSKLIGTHYRLQSGRFISRCEEIEAGFIMQSDISLAPMWNHAAWVGGSTDSLSKFVCDLPAAWNGWDSRPVLYLSAEDLDGSELESLVQPCGYERFDRESWMIHRLRDPPLVHADSNLTVVRACNEREADDLAAVFRAAYLNTDSRCGAELRREVLQTSNEIFHYIGYGGGEPLSITTVIEQDGVGGIYNVGTVPNARGRGYAGELIAHVIAESATRGTRYLLLQVDAGSGAERLYRRLGFETEFVRFGYRLKKETAPSFRHNRRWNHSSDVSLSGLSRGTRLSSYKSVAEMFEERAAASPEAIAVVLPKTGDGSQGAEELTYRDLSQRANRLARRLRQFGVGPDVFVGLFLGRSFEMIIGLMAIWKAGGAVLPMDMTWPSERLAFMLDDAKPLVVLTQTSTQAYLPRTDAFVLCLDSMERLDESAEAPFCAASEESLAYVIYTSGSTGQPKGVLVPNGALAGHALECQEDYALTPDDCVLQFSSLCFDAAFEQIVPALISGARIVLRGEEIWSVQEFSAYLARYDLTLIDLTTGYWHQLAHEWAARPERVPPNRVRLVIVGGEAMQPETLRLWRRTPFKDVRLINAYGPTEATITATSFEVNQEFLFQTDFARVPIGRPRGARSIFIVDKENRQAPVGQVGELCIGGPLLARGYLNRPELTRAKFAANPFNGDTNEPLYRTGDLARYRPDGNIEFFGRIDDQVKIRGFRVELGEIETHLLAHPAVREAAVIIRERGDTEKKLVACVVGKNAASGPTAKELRRFLTQRLPDYMMPAQFVVMDALPLLPNGKVNRRALTETLSEPVQCPSTFKGPSEPLELRLQLVFEKVLKRCPIGVDISFFELGGDSLQALELLIQIEQLTGKSLPLGTLYQSSTVQGLARLLKTDISPENDSPLIPLQPHGSRPPVFLIHTTPGDILGYGNLIYHLDPQQPCFGVQSLGWHRPEELHDRVEDMAAYDIELIRSLQPQGPYYLGGWCYGGIVSVEMAHQLLALGEKVAFLGLLETLAPRPSPRVYRYYLHRLNCVLRTKPQRWVPYVRAKLRYFEEKKRANKLRFQRVTPAPDERAAACEQLNRKLAQLERVYNTNMAALGKYRPRPYPGQVTLFNATVVDPAIIPDREYGWPGMASDIEVHTVPGDHDTMLMEPHVAVLAEKFATALQDAQRRFGNGARRMIEQLSVA